MTINELSQLFFLTREIERLESEKDRLERAGKKDIVKDTVKGSYAYFPYTEHSILIKGIEEEGYKITKHDLEIAELKGLIELNIKKSIIERIRLERYISSIEDAEMRQIIALRYVNGLAWRQIANELGYQDESVPRKKHNRFLKNKNDRKIRI